MKHEHLYKNRNNQQGSYISRYFIIQGRRGKTKVHFQGEKEEGVQMREGRKEEKGKRGQERGRGERD